MALLELIIVVVLLFEVGSGQERIHRFHRPGQDATLPCGTQSSNISSSCSNISWLYNREAGETLTVAINRNVVESSPRAARLSVDTNCSLVIKRITAEDVGRYTCRLNNDVNHDRTVSLNLLTISLIPADADPRRGDEVTLECSLLRYTRLPACQQNGLRWVDETGTVLSEGVVKLSRQADCVSNLTVKRQSGNDRTYTCQFVNKDNKEEIQAAYTPVFTDPPSDPDPRPDPDPTDPTFINVESTEWSSLSYVMLALRITALILMIVCTAVVIRHRGSFKPINKDNDVQNDVIEVTYENVEARPAAERH
uniref:uncharacterized protein n=1 Tax=Semicossyphus pulcher TaxID=241346 RepID=UPI0037E76DA1